MARLSPCQTYAVLRMADKPAGEQSPTRRHLIVFHYRYLAARSDRFPNPSDSVMKHSFFADTDLASSRITPIGELLIVTVALLTIVGIGAADIYLGHEISLSVLYLLPVAATTWYVGKQAGWIICAASTGAIVGEHLLSGYNAQNPIAAAWSAIVHLIFMLSFIWLFSRLREMLELQEKLATIDPLTGVMNRRAFMERLTFVFRFAEREKLPVTLIYIDVDNFKQINDRYGHAEGDRILRCIGDSLIRSTRKSDLVCRLGGDEFVVVLPDSSGWHARDCARKLQHTLSSSLGSPPVTPTCSIGCVTFMTPPTDMETALAAGDSMMYRVKRRGKNQIAFDEAAG